MGQIEPEQKQSKKSEIAIAALLITITVIAVVYLNFYYTADNNQDNTDIIHSASYQNLTAEAAYNLKNNVEDLLIVEIGSCQCKWKGNCIDPNALWTVNPADLINETRDILVYSYSGDDVIEFCDALVNKTYGEIYYIEGGTQAWKDLGYPTYNCKEE